MIKVSVVSWTLVKTQLLIDKSLGDQLDVGENTIIKNEISVIS